MNSMVGEIIGADLKYIWHICITNISNGILRKKLNNFLMAGYFLVADYFMDMA